MNVVAIVLFFIFGEICGVFTTALISANKINKINDTMLKDFKENNKDED